MLTRHAADHNENEISLEPYYLLQSASSRDWDPSESDGDSPGS